MKPIKLEMRGFMTYKDEIVIDFTKLYPKKIFVISGDTGSGKTTIFDGINYALYGGISRGVNVEDLRSDFLSDSDPYTYVRLTFEVYNNIYVIERIPKQRADKNGKSIDLSKNTATFYQVGYEKESLITKIKEIDSKIHEIIGLDQNQFSKVMLLAQGEFQQFLKADSKTRAVLMGDIFKTHMYDQIQVNLKLKSKDTQDRLSQIQNDLYKEIDRDDELKDLVDIGDVSTKNFISILKSVDEIKKVRSEVYRNESDRLDKARKSHNILIADREKSITNNENIRRLAEINEKLEHTEKDEEKYKVLKENLTKSNIAVNISSYEERLDKAKSDYENAKASLSKATENLNNTLDDINKNKDLFISLSDKNKSLDQLKESRNYNINLLNDLKEFNNKKTQYLNIENDLKKIGEININLARFRDELENLYKEANQKNKIIDELKDQDRSIENNIRDVSEIIKNLDEDINIYKKNQEILDEIGRNSDKVLKLSEEKINLTNLTKAYENNRKLIEINKLIDDLNKDGICPVCGKAHEGHLEKLHTIEIDIDDVNQKLVAVNSNLLSLSATNETLEKSIREVSDISLLNEQKSDLFKSLKDQNDMISQIKSDLKSKQDEVDILNETIVKINNLISQSQIELENLSELTKNSDDLKAYYQANKKIFESLDETILANDLDSINKNIEILGDEIKSIRGLENTLNLSREKYKTQISNLDENINKLDNDIITYKNSLYEKIAKDFKSYDDYKTYLDLHSELIIKVDEIDKFFNLINELRIKKESLSKYEGMDLIDLTLINEKISESEDDISSINSNLSDINHGILNIESVRNNILILRDEFSEIESNAQIFNHLSQVANGEIAKVAGRQKINFETFVLTYYFDKVLVLANQRLHHMSNGQFSMVRNSDARDLRKGSGLDIEILDANTGKLRPASTLSGGESFLASLSLALGLSDEISQESGGISIDTLFIDEGFGTLSDDYLNKVIEQIERLSYENKFVGLISHVNELKDAIDAKILVSYDQANGSSIEVIS